MEEQTGTPSKEGGKTDIKTKVALAKEEPKSSGKVEGEESTSLEIKEDPKAKTIDEDSKRLTAFFSTLSLNVNQKAEVKNLLKIELEQSVSTLKSDVKKESEDTKKDFLTFFGLFASFVTFLSIEVQLFKNSDNVSELIGVSSISLSFVMFFALILNDLIKKDVEFKDLAKPKYLINILFLIVGVICLFYGSNEQGTKIKLLEAKVLLDSARIERLNSDLGQSRSRLKKVDSTILKWRQKYKF